MSDVIVQSSIRVTYRGKHGFDWHHPSHHGIGFYNTYSAGTVYPGYIYIIMQLYIIYQAKHVLGTFINKSHSKFYFGPMIF